MRGREGRQPAPRSLKTSSFPGVLVKGCFCAASDLCLLGQLLWQHQHLVASPQGRQFLDAVHQPAVRQRLSARALLSHPWIGCRGDDDDDDDDDDDVT